MTETKHQYKGYTIIKSERREEGSRFSPAFGRHRRYSKWITYYFIKEIRDSKGHCLTFDRLKDAKTHINKEINDEKTR